MRFTIALILGWLVFQGCADTERQDVKITSDGGVYTLTFGSLRAKIDAAYGGRITSFSYRDHQILTGREIDSLNFGSTLFPSPQSRWGWPPVAALDRATYDVLQDQNKLHLRSPVDSALGISLGKVISVNTVDTTLQIDYYFKNHADTTVSYALWEVTRLHKGGTIVYPEGKSYEAHKSFKPIQTRTVDGLKVYRDPMQLPDVHRLNIHDGSNGWMAFVRDGFAYIKQFEPISPEQFAPGEGEILYYLSPERPYIEMEVQGPYQSIAPGDSLKWSVAWKLRPVDILQKPTKLNTFLRKAN